MKVKVIPMGGGLNRLVVEPQCSCELSTPSHIVDRMVADVIHREKCATPQPRLGGVVPRPIMPRVGGIGPRPIMPRVCNSSRRAIENAWRDTPNEPHGIDIHVDRPLRENFWSHHEWAKAMAKYRTLEDVAKDCDWPCKEPMKGTTVEHWGRPCCQPVSPIRRAVSCTDLDWAVPTFASNDDLSWMW